jgi:hypothetical protein
MRNASSSFTAAAEVMRHCAKLADDWSDALKIPGASNGKRKAAADEEDEPAANGKRKRVAKKKDPNAPKRPASSYLLFQNEIRKDIKERFPNLSNTELLNVIKTQWAEMSDDQKSVCRVPPPLHGASDACHPQVYHDKMTKEKERYTAAKTAYDARSPEEVARADAEVAAAIAVRRIPLVRIPR